MQFGDRVAPLSVTPPPLPRSSDLISHFHPNDDDDEEMMLVWLCRSTTIFPFSVHVHVTYVISEWSSFNFFFSTSRGGGETRL